VDRSDWKAEDLVPSLLPSTNICWLSILIRPTSWLVDLFAPSHDPSMDASSWHTVIQPNEWDSSEALREPWSR